MPIKIKINANNSWLQEAGYSEEEEAKIYSDNLQDILDNPRWYLDNIGSLREYKVRWNCYTNKHKKGRVDENGKFIPRNPATLPFHLVNSPN